MLGACNLAQHPTTSYPVPRQLEEVSEQTVEAERAQAQAKAQGKALLAAIQLDDFSQAQEVLRFSSPSPDVLVSNDFGCTAAHLLAERSGDDWGRLLGSLLLYQSAQVAGELLRGRSHDGRTVLHYAVGSGNPKRLRALAVGGEIAAAAMPYRLTTDLVNHPPLPHCTVLLLLPAVLRNQDRPV